MKGHISHELEVKVPAGGLWEVYSGLKLPKLIYELLPNLVKNVEVVEGDGGVGTVLKVVFPEGTTAFTPYKEKFTKIDEEKRIKQAEVVEGGYLELGFSLYRVTFQIIEKDAESSIIKSTVDYELDDKFADNASVVSTKPLEAISEAIGNHLAKDKVNANIS